MIISPNLGLANFSFFSLRRRPEDVEASPVRLRSRYEMACSATPNNLDHHAGSPTDLIGGAPGQT
jgi:hypothetical protein